MARINVTRSSMPSFEDYVEEIRDLWDSRWLTNAGSKHRQLQQQLGKKILVCAGDAENDLSMMRDADFAFAPADGIIADRFETVCDCGKGAVADVIYEKIPEILSKRS